MSTRFPLATALVAAVLALVPAVAGAAVTHTIQPGETLSGIAAQWKCLENMQTFNRFDAAEADGCRARDPATATSASLRDNWFIL